MSHTPFSYYGPRYTPQRKNPNNELETFLRKLMEFNDEKYHNHELSFATDNKRECLNSLAIGSVIFEVKGASLQVSRRYEATDTRPENVIGFRISRGGELVLVAARKFLVGLGRSYYRRRPPFYRRQDKRPESIDKTMPSLDLSSRNEDRFRREDTTSPPTPTSTLISVFHSVKLQLYRR